MTVARCLIAVDGSTNPCDATCTAFDLVATLAAQATTACDDQPTVPGSCAVEGRRFATRDDKGVLDGLQRAIGIPDATSHLVPAGRSANMMAQVVKGWHADQIDILGTFLQPTSQRRFTTAAWHVDRLFLEDVLRDRAFARVPMRRRIRGQQLLSMLSDNRDAPTYLTQPFAHQTTARGH